MSEFVRHPDQHDARPSDDAAGTDVRVPPDRPHPAEPSNVTTKEPLKVVEGKALALLAKSDANFKAAGHQRISAGLLFLEVKQRVEAGEAGERYANKWERYCEDHLAERSMSDIRKCIALAKSPDPLAAQAQERARAREGMARHRSNVGAVQNQKNEPGLATARAAATAPSSGSGVEQKKATATPAPTSVSTASTFDVDIEEVVGRWQSFQDGFKALGPGAQHAVFRNRIAMTGSPLEFVEKAWVWFREDVYPLLSDDEQAAFKKRFDPRATFATAEPEK